MVPELDDRIRSLLPALDRNSQWAAEALDKLVAEDGNAFLGAIVPLLKDEGATAPGLRRVYGSLLSARLLPNPLRLSLEDDIEIACRQKQADPALDVKLARYLSDSVLRDPNAGDRTFAIRVLEVLDAVSERHRILPILVQLMRHTDQRVRSKAALLLAHRNKSPQLVEQLLTETDPRVRANAVEALWGVDNQSTRDVLWQATKDPNNRVVGNALLGLYRLGDPTTIRHVLEMAANPDPLFRSTAAWVMGETVDPRFLPTLTGMIRETQPVTRRSVFRALGLIQRGVAKLHEAPGLKVHVCQVLTEQNGTRVVQAAIADCDGRAVAGLLPTRILLTDSGALVVDYTVNRGPIPDLLAVGLVVPSSSGEALEACLEIKRGEDRFCLARYGPDEVDEGRSPLGADVAGGHPFFLAADVEALRANARSLAILRPSLDDALRALLIPLGRANGTRHLLVVCDGALSPKEGQQQAGGWDPIVAMARGSSICLHAVTGPNVPAPFVGDLSRTCRRTGGFSVSAASVDRIPVVASSLYLRLLYPYDISYHPGEGAPPGELKLQIVSAQGCGEDRLPAKAAV